MLRAVRPALLLVLLAACAVDPPPLASHRQRLVGAFGAGALVIPTGNGQQNAGVLRAHGLVYALLRADVPVHWLVRAGKLEGEADAVAEAPAVVVNRESRRVLGLPQSYRSGAFVVDAEDRSAALPIVDAWLAADDVTVVHDVLQGPITGDVAKTLTAAPSIAVAEDGTETVPYAFLNAAGIRDGAGGTWSRSSPTSLAWAQIAGSSRPGDGALFTSGASFLVAAHATNPGAEGLGEVRQWLDDPATHAFFQCASIPTFENTLNLLTTNGIATAGGVPSPLARRVSDAPLAQYDGRFFADTGATQTLALRSGSALKPGARVLVNDADLATDRGIVLASGPVNGDIARGRVTYLTGHDYSVATPVSLSPLTNGARLFLNAIFDSPSALAAHQPEITLVASAPPATRESLVTTTIAYTNEGAAPAFDVVLTVPLALDATFASATGGGTSTGRVVTWNVGTLAPRTSATVTFTVVVASDTTLSTRASATYRAWLTPRTRTSAEVRTVHDTTASETRPDAGQTPPTADVAPAPAPTPASGALVPADSLGGGGTDCAFHPARGSSGVFATLALFAGARLRARRRRDATKALRAAR